MSATEYPLRLFQKVRFLGLDGYFHIAKVVTVTDVNNCFATIIPRETPRHLQRDTTEPWRGGSFFLEVTP